MGTGAAQRRLIVIGVATGAVALLLAGLFRGERTPSEPMTPKPVPSADVQNSTRPPEARRAAFLPPSPLTSEAGGGEAEGEPSALDRAAYPVDLERLREKLPDNLYFRLGAPTEDTDILAAREEEERRWNDLYGKVQSNTATEEEIQRYYDHRRALSEDYIKFAELVLAEYGDKLPEQDRGLYELAIKMHRGRLGEIPKQIEDARARSAAHEALRQKQREGGQGKSSSP
jgi:hypothetical protein